MVLQLAGVTLAQLPGRGTPRLRAACSHLALHPAAGTACRMAPAVTEALEAASAT
jgi:hypothetical protein